MGGEFLGVKFIDAGGEVGFAGVVTLAEDFVQSRRIAAEGRLRQGDIDDGDGYLAVF